ncbi:MAG TPA: ATP-binding cassette domain-containing protein [Rugosimonospora sp.]|nr:ATP-binding cassette domain-containing protein [Rugosimonospora sp.]
MSDLLRVIEVTRRYGDLVALDNVSLSLAPGERRALIGPNGAGKTTLLDLVAGVTRPQRGQIVFDGRDVTRLGPVARARLGIGRTHQHPAVWPGLSALDNVVVGGWLRAGGVRRLYSPGRLRHHLLRPSLRVLDSVGLGRVVGVPAGELSHGQRRLLEIGMALAGAPRLLILDEPAAGLWPAEVEQLTTLLARLPAGTAVLLVEHHLQFAYAVADTVTVLREGRPVATVSATDTGPA